MNSERLTESKSQRRGPHENGRKETKKKRKKKTGKPKSYYGLPVVQSTAQNEGIELECPNMVKCGKFEINENEGTT